MRIISKTTLSRFGNNREGALDPLMFWYSIARRARWQNIVDVRQDFSHADAVGEFTVFNIGGNKYRLITVIKYRWQTIYIRNNLTHVEYSKEKWKS